LSCQFYIRALIWRQEVFFKSSLIVGLVEGPDRIGERKFNAEEVEMGLVILRSSELLQISETGLVSIHPVLQQTIRDQFMSNEESQIKRVLKWLMAEASKKKRNEAADQAQELLIPHLEAIIKHYDLNGLKKDELLAMALVQLGDLYFEFRWQPQESLVFFEQALKVQRALPNQLEMSFTLIKLSEMYEILEKIDKKLDLLKEALRIQEKIYGLNDHKLSPLLEELSKTYDKVGDESNKRALLARASIIKSTRCQSKETHRPALPATFPMAAPYRAPS